MTVVSSIRQQPHTGISLIINEKAYTDSEAVLDCSPINGVLDSQVTYHCNPKQSAYGTTVTIQTNTEFCETLLKSQQINITVVEQRVNSTTAQIENAHGMYKHIMLYMNTIV